MPAKKKLTFEDIRREKQAPRKTIEVDLDGNGKVAEFTFQGIGRRAFTELSEAHSSDDDTSGWDVASFAPALVAASSLEPSITPAQAKELWDDPAWTIFDLDKLFTAALSVNANLAPARR